ncbi:MAG: pilus assembly protein N-terminal domain-containing protein, partial [Phenylobacterium sp.]|nr:pilus assembly protein N-terminal domain-containing protein [Phenylobacterium sp.]
MRLAALGVACTLAPLSVQAADILPPEMPEHAALDAPLHKSTPLRASGAVGRVVVSQPELVEAGMAGPRDIYLIGRDLGTTNLLIYDTAGRLTQTMDVRVGYDAQSLRNDLAEALPDEEIAVTSLASGLLLEGDVSS